MQTSVPVFLIGFMGCGKTYWGRLLAQKLDRPFDDLDDLIEARAKQSIAEIFKSKGEPEFRALERDALLATLNFSNLILATGGGAPCFFDNMDWMNAHGTTIYLKTPPTLLVERLRAEKHIRPLLAGVQDGDLLRFIEMKLSEREAYYLQAKIVVEQSEKQEDVLEKILVHLFASE